MNEPKFTPGPWCWHGNASSNSMHLATVDRGKTYVMSFRRWGFRGAQPFFQGSRCGRLGMIAANLLLKFEVGNKSVTGTEEAKAEGSVYRLDFVAIDHPDAHLIVAAPDMYDFIATLENDDGKIPAWLWDKRTEVLAKARGE